MISQVGLIIVNFADNVMVGHYSTESLASASFVINVFNVPMMCLMGFSYGLTPLIGLLFARRRNGDIGHMLRAGMKVNVIAGAILTSVMLLLYPLLPHMGQPEELMHLIRPFYLIYVAGLLPMTVFNAFAQWSYAVRNTSMPMWILLTCNAANIIGNYALIFGHWGAPELGLVGAGLSTLFARVAAPVAIVLIFFMSKSGRPYRATFRERMRRAERRALMGKVTRTSWPVALQMTFETCAFSLCAVLAGWLGTISLAAFQIIVVVGMLGFCIYYSVGTAIAVLVSNRMGEADGGAGRASACRRGDALFRRPGLVDILFLRASGDGTFLRRSRGAGPGLHPCAAANPLSARRRHSGDLRQRSARHLACDADAVDSLRELCRDRAGLFVGARFPLRSGRLRHRAQFLGIALHCRCPLPPLLPESDPHAEPLIPPEEIL